MFEKDTVIHSEDRLSAAHLDGEAIVLDTSSGTYFGVNQLGARILTLIESPVSLSRIVETLSREYDVEASRIEEDVVAFLTELREKELVSLGA